MRTPTIKKTERYIDKIYDETVKSELKKEIFLELQHRFLAEIKETKTLDKLIQSLNDQISTLKSEISLLQEELKEKDPVIRILLNMRCKPSENYRTSSCSNHLSRKSLERSSSNNNYYINNNISKNDNKINNNNINNNKASNNNIIDNCNIIITMN